MRFPHMPFIVAGVVVALAGSGALADWDVGDPHKMHYPQLPDMNGWDVRATYYTGLADDFQCAETGPILDFHIWTSAKGDLMVQDEDVEFIHTAIYTDIPAGLDTYSQPGDRLWHHDWKLDPAIGTYTTRDWGTGNQGWYDPLAGIVIEDDHTMVQQWNFYIDPLEAFVQEEGAIYWLEVSFKLTPLAVEQGKRIGWKTTQDHWNDDAVYREIVEGGENVWQELRDPITNESLDLAFVITPEPTSLLLLALGGLMLGRRRR